MQLKTSPKFPLSGLTRNLILAPVFHASETLAFVTPSITALSPELPTPEADDVTHPNPNPPSLVADGSVFGFAAIIVASAGLLPVAPENTYGL